MRLVIVAIAVCVVQMRSGILWSKQRSGVGEDTLEWMRPTTIRGRADDRAMALPSYDHGLPAKLRIIPLLDGSVKRIHVHVDDFADAHLATILFSLPEGCERPRGGRSIANWAVR